MKILPTTLPGVIVIEPDVFGDARGFFMETYQDKRYREIGIKESFVQDSEDNHRQMYIPPGFAHGFCVLSEVADFTYKCTDYYDPASERGIAWNDPDLGIVWPLTDVILSDKDKKNLRLCDMADEDLPDYS